MVDWPVQIHKLDETPPVYLPAETPTPSDCLSSRTNLYKGSIQPIDMYKFVQLVYPAYFVYTGHAW